MGGKTISNSETKIEALKLQSSAYGVTIPMVLGVQKIAGNLLDYLSFKAVPHTQTQGGKGGGVKVQNTTYTYQADVIMGLCHGPITEVPRIWRGKKLFAGGWGSSQIVTASEPYTVPSSGPMVYTVANAAAWLGIVEVSYTSTTEVGNESGSTTTYQAMLAQGSQYTAAAGVITVLDAALRGVELTIRYQHTSGSRPETAMEQLGLSFKAGTIGQAAWSQLPSGRNVPYSGIAWVAGTAYDLGTGAQVENHVFEVVGPLAYHLGATVPDVDPALAIRAVLTHAQGGAGFPAGLLDSWQAWSDYCVASGLLVSLALDAQQSAAEVLRSAAELTNAGIVWSDGLIKMVPYADTAASGNGRTFTPNTTLVYQLNDDCYTPPDSGPPVRVVLKSPAERFNHWRVEFLNRANAYAVEIAEAEDAADIDANGRRSADVLKAHWICDAPVARQVAQIKLQRSLAVCAEYMFALPEHYALIEPTDLLTLTDGPLEMADVPVRVTVIEEQDDGGLSLTSEDYPAGTASAAIYPSQVGAGYGADYNAAPGDCDAPTIFEAPAALTLTGLELYVAVRGSGANWGGAAVWVSLDGSNYRQIGAVYGPSRYGALSANMSSGASSMAVSGLGAAQLVSGSATDAQMLSTLCYVGGTNREYLAYQTATITGAGAYTLAGLVRGAYGTASAAHSSADAFVRVDERIAKSGDLDLALVGQTIYIKVCAFNVFGGAQQGLADVSPYTYTITGAMAAQANASGGQVYRQSADPALSAFVPANSLWFDTDDGNKQYLRSGGAWISVRDGGIQAGLDAAAAAQAAADGKIASFYQASPPGSADEGDLWFDTDDGNKQYIRAGGVWVLAADTRIGTALTVASDAQATADGKVTTFVASSAPTADAVGDLWLDSDDGNKLYRWNGSAWLALPIGTGALALESATETDTDVDGVLDVGSGPSDPSTSVDEVVRSVSYTNGTGAAVPVQFLAGLTGAIMVKSGGVPATAEALLQWSSATLSGQAVLCSAWPDQSLPAAPQVAPVAAGQVLLPAGETLTVNLRMRLIHDDAAFFQWEYAYAQLAAIKR